MYNPFMLLNRKYVFLTAGIAILAITGLLWRALRFLPAFVPPPEPPISDLGTTATGTTPVEFQRSLRQGTQMHVSQNVDIGLISVFDGVAALSVRDAGHDPKVRTLKVVPGDAFDVSGYAVTVLEVKELPSFSLATGSGKDYVVFKFKKK